MRNFPPQYNLQENDALYFPHIPKTAGMTFRTILEDQFPCEDTCPATLKAQFQHITSEELKRYRLYRGHLSYIDIPGIVSAEKRVVNVTVLREPVARVISHYEYIRRMPGDPHYEAVKEMSLEEFAYKLPVGKVGKNVQVYYVAKLLKYNLHRVPPEETLAIAKESLDQFAFVGLLERFQDSLFLLSYIFGWKPILNSRKENAASSPTKKLSETIPESTLEAIRENTLLDKELYSYAEEIFTQRFDAMVQDLVEKYGRLVETPEPLSPDTKPNSEILRQLLELHAQERYRQLHLPPSTAAIYDFCQPLRGIGWQRRECPDNPEDPAYRWIGPGTEASLDLPVNAGDETEFHLELRAICTWLIPSDLLESLTVEVNGHPIALYTLYRDPGVKLMQGKVSAEVIAAAEPFATVKLWANRSVPINSLNPLSNDTRSVAIACNYIHIFPATQEPQKSASLLLFQDPIWQEAGDFVEKRLEPGEKVAAPLAFKARLAREVQDSADFLQDHQAFDWVIIHKSMTDRVMPMLFRLVWNGFGPVFANDVFLIFSKQPGAKRLSYLAPHVRSLYLGRIKTYTRFYFERLLKPWVKRKLDSIGQNS